MILLESERFYMAFLIYLIILPQTFLYFKKKHICLGLDLDWIQIQQSLEPDRFREKPGSGSGFS
jgi:hypothetical protein